MRTAVVFGGTGYIGSHLATYFISKEIFDKLYLVDVESPNTEYLPDSEKIKYLNYDVRKEIPTDDIEEPVDWIFNFAAVHREPGHEDWEYFDTNIKGAQNVCSFAESIKCSNIFFTSSISVYGPTEKATSERSLKTPNSAYGSSKYAAELIQEKWKVSGVGRRLLVVRPGVVYGPGDPGNILRMIRAIKKGYFAYPGSVNIKKSYAYIYGLLESMIFFIEKDIDYVEYNYVENPTESLDTLTKIIKQELNSKAPILSLPQFLLKPISKVVYSILGDKTSIHPRRVEKAAMPTHIIPQVLIDENFMFDYDFRTSLKHWRKIAPDDFT